MKASGKLCPVSGVLSTVVADQTRYSLEGRGTRRRQLSEPQPVVLAKLSTFSASLRGWLHFPGWPGPPAAEGVTFWVPSWPGVLCHSLTTATESTPGLGWGSLLARTEAQSEFLCHEVPVLALAPSPFLNLLRFYNSKMPVGSERGKCLLSSLLDSPAGLIIKLT